MRGEKDIFMVGLKLVGVLNIIWGLIALLNSIPSIFNDFYRLGIFSLYHGVIPLTQSAIGLYLLKDGRIFRDIAYSQDIKKMPL